MAYGHRREGDCRDIEVLAAPAPLDRNSLGSLMDGISPRGKTPIGAAVRAPRDSLGPGDAASVVVVTNGLENCGADLCALDESWRNRARP
jgi:hypothetical protein